MKAFFVAILLIFSLSGAFAQETKAKASSISVGVGVDVEQHIIVSDYKPGGVDFKTSQFFGQHCEYVYADFFDYFQVSAGLSNGFPDYLVSTVYPVVIEDDRYKYSLLGLRLGALVKIPIPLEFFILSPYGGIDFILPQSQKINDLELTEANRNSYQDFFGRFGVLTEIKMSILVVRLNLGMGINGSPENQFTDTPDAVLPNTTLRTENGFKNGGVKLIAGLSIGIGL